MTIPASFANLGWKTYIIYAVLNASFIPIIYFFLVETKGRSLEELDIVFAAPGDPVKNEKRMPYDIDIDEARRTLGLDDSVTRRLSKVNTVEQREERFLEKP